jgi:3-isopropylmalate/(R)-2-methylmalate dehydratase small subunit
MIVGKSWTFGHHINTDVIMPGEVYDQSEAIQTRATFAAIRPGFAERFASGDLIVAGENFGTGSSRPAARSLRNLGCCGLLADSINSLFFRNCVNFGLLALQCPGISAAVREGDLVEIDVARWTVRNVATGMMLAATPIPEALLVIMQGGGLLPLMERQGLIAPVRPQRDSNQAAK